jgi:hypothetical protein
MLPILPEETLALHGTAERFESAFMHEHPNTLHQQLSNTLYRQRQYNRSLLKTQRFCLIFTASMMFRCFAHSVHFPQVSWLRNSTETRRNPDEQNI